jgi:hypothetical protein
MGTSRQAVRGNGLSKGNIMDRRKFISSSVAVGGALVGTGLIGKPGSAAGTPPLTSF